MISNPMFFHLLKRLDYNTHQYDYGRSSNNTDHEKSCESGKKNSAVTWLARI